MRCSSLTRHNGFLMPRTKHGGEAYGQPAKVIPAAVVWRALLFHGTQQLRHRTNEPVPEPLSLEHWSRDTFLCI